MKTFIDILVELEESVVPVKKRVNKAKRREQHIDYLKTKAKKKAKAKKYHKTSRYTKWKKKTKAKKPTGRTATGKRITKFIGS